MSDWEERPNTTRSRTPVLVVVVILVFAGAGIALAGGGPLGGAGPLGGDDPEPGDEIPIETGEAPLPETQPDPGADPDSSADTDRNIFEPDIDPVGEWRQIADAPILERAHATAIWTGTEVLVFGGERDTDWLTDGAAYDPARNTWRPIPEAPFDSEPIDEASAVWTGTEMVVVSSRSRSTAAYDPDADTWRTLPPQPMMLQGAASLAWDGTEVISIGPLPSSATDTAAVRAFALDPAAEEWRELASPPVRGFGVLPIAATLDDTIVAVGRAAFSDDGRLAVTSYDRETETWSPVEAAPFDATTNTWLVDVAVGQTGSGLVVAGSVRTPEWRSVAAVWGPDRGWLRGPNPQLSTHPRPHVAVTPGGILIWTGQDPSGLVFDRDAWLPLPALEPTRIGAAVTWTGQDLFVWGGRTAQWELSDGHLWRARDRTLEYCCSP